VIDADEIIRMLGLKPHPQEGGFFAETYRSPDLVADGLASAGQKAGKSLATAIYYLLKSGTYSAMHRLPTDEILHFYMGDAVTMLLLDNETGGRTVTLGADIAAGQRPQIVVPGGVWQGSCLSERGEFALMGTTMAPGYDDSDYETGDREVLRSEFPDWSELIERLTS